MREPRGIVFLVGFMGAGKTTAGIALARLLGWDFVDLDELIAEREGRSIAEIFREDGEAYFRRVEAEALSTLRGRSRLVVACGGGTYAREATRRLIDGMGRAVWLRLSLARALARCERPADRPLLRDAAQAEALYRSRLPAYRSAPLSVEVDGLAPEQVAERIEALL
ncbi:MAG: shikimate kinase [Acidobacteriota bacterium]